MTRKKGRVIMIVSIILFTVLLMFVCVAYLLYIPDELTYMRVYVGCAKVDGANIHFVDESPESSFCPRDGERWGLCNNYGGSDLSMDIRLSTALTKLAVYSQAEKAPSDVQVAKICYYADYADKEELGEVLFAYDFLTEKRYMFKNETWYEIHFAPFLDSYIQFHYDESFGVMGYSWRGQSTFTLQWDIPISEEERNQASFRYNLYWLPTLRPDQLPSYQSAGFNVTEAREISNREQAIQLAAEEMGYANYSAIAFYDETNDYWMVEIVDTTGFEGGVVTLSEESSFYLYHNTYVLVINDQGLIIEKYQDISNSAHFWSK